MESLIGIASVGQSRFHIPELKGKFSMEAISDRRTLQVTTCNQAVYPIQLGHWKKQMLEEATSGR